MSIVIYANGIFRNWKRWLEEGVKTGREAERYNLLLKTLEGLTPEERAFIYMRYAYSTKRIPGKNIKLLKQRELAKLHKMKLADYLELEKKILDKAVTINRSIKQRIFERENAKRLLERERITNRTFNTQEETNEKY